MKADLEKSEWETIRQMLQDDLKNLRSGYNSCDTPYTKAAFTRRIKKLTNILNKIPQV